MKALSVCGIGHALVDVQARLDEHSFIGLGLERGSSGLIHDEDCLKLLGLLPECRLRHGTGGSAANSIYLVSQIGGRGAFIGRTAMDDFGALFREELDQRGIVRSSTISAEGKTGVSIVFVTPDGERTMCTSLGVSKDIGPEDIDSEMISRSAWVLLEGYLATNGPRTMDMLEAVVKKARSAGTRIALSVGSRAVAIHFREEIIQLARCSDLLFANQSEADALTAIRDVDGAFAHLQELSGNVVMTLGREGSLIRYGREEFKLRVPPVDVVDATGAGDSFAGAFLYGIANNYTARESAEVAAALAGRVVAQLGARLPSVERGLFS